VTTTEPTTNGQAPAEDALREASNRLLEPFSEQEIGLLPRVVCGACSKSDSGACGNHAKQKCPECDAYVSTRHIHLSYVGHADVTHRLLQVDPAWTWEPVGVDDAGRPLFDRDDRGGPVGLWIRLTVAGVTRLGYGSCPSRQNDAVKVLIGDALRNAALRFGVAWDLWAKGDRNDPAAENVTSTPDNAVIGGGQPRSGRTGQRRSAQPQPEPSLDEAGQARAALQDLATEHHHDWITVRKAFKVQTGQVLAKHQGAAEIRSFTEALRSNPQHVLALAEQSEQSAPGPTEDRSRTSAFDAGTDERRDS
jgi:hypothetical protein